MFSLFNRNRNPIDLETIMPFNEQLNALIDLHENKHFLRKWCRNECQDLVELKNSNPEGDSALFGEHVLCHAINSAMAVADPNALYPHITVQMNGHISIDKANMWDRFEGKPGSAFEMTRDKAMSNPDGFERHAIEWFKRNDYAGFRAAMSGRPREQFEDDSEAAFRKREDAAIMATLGLIA